MGSYDFLAGSYDALTTDVNYSRWADYAQRHFARAGREIRTVLDLCCGTGSMTWELCGRGYTVTGVDISAEMLAVAEEKCRGLENRPRFFCEPMEALRLPGRMDACVCFLDSVNYVLESKKLRRAFQRVWEHLEPGGVFLFDADTPEKLSAMDGQIFLDETEEELCIWRGEYSVKRRLCSFWMDIFRREGALWRRGEELHREYAYTMDELEEYLKEAGFEKVRRFGELRMSPPREKEQRIFFTAARPL